MNEDKNKLIKFLCVWIALIIIIALIGISYIKKSNSSVVGVSSVSSVNSPKEETVTERYYMVTDNLEEATNAAAEAGGEVESYDNGVAVIIVKKPLYRFLGAFGVDMAPDEIEAGESVLKKETVYYIDSKTPPELNKKYDDLWYRDEIRIENTYKNNITGKAAVVAVIDTGCDIGHPDLKDNIIGTYNAAEPTNKAVTDKDGHGTHVAGIIAARDNSIGVVGIAPEASLYIIKADHGTEGSMYLSDIIRGINKAIEVNADVINMSLGCYYRDEDMEVALKNATEHGILCVAAAGNEVTDAPHYPSAFSECMGVASYDELLELSVFSNYGSVNADIAAPGSDILSTIPNNKYDELSGTSMATPIVSGVAALIYGNEKSVRENNTLSSSEYVRKKILDARNKKTYKYTQGSVKGGVDIQNIFKVKDIDMPDAPSLKTSTEKVTNQGLVKVNCGTKDVKLLYTTDGSFPYEGAAKECKNGKNIHIDKNGTYTVTVVALKKRTYSEPSKVKITVKGVKYTQKLLKNMRIHLKNEKTTTIGVGKSAQLYVTLDGDKKKTIDVKNVKWSSSNNKLATVSSDGKVKVINDKKKIGKKVTISGKVGSITKTFEFTIK